MNIRSTDLIRRNKELKTWDFTGNNLIADPSRHGKCWKIKNIYTKMRWTQPAPTVQRTYGADKSVRGLKCLCLRLHLKVWHIFCLPVFILCWRQKTFQSVHLRPCRCKSLGLLPPLQITGGSGKLYFRPIFGSLQWKCSGPCCVLMCVIFSPALEKSENVKVEFLTRWG